MIPELPSAVTEIPVSDVAAATEYYRDKLSCSVDAGWRCELQTLCRHTPPLVRLSRQSVHFTRINPCARRPYI
jgi:hypothetical protein